MATSHMTSQIGRVLGGRYRLVAPIGAGTSAQVFLAEDVTLRRRVAVKVLHPGLAADESFLRRFGAEARAAAALSHPNVMAVYDWGEDDGPYLVLEYLGGGSLAALLDSGARLDQAQAAWVGIQAAQALDAAHRRGFVHRDIKPANLVFGDDDRLRVADFGLARALSEAAWTEPVDGMVGTARYAAPEQASSSRIDGRADLYALGLVLVEAITGVVPLTADTNLGTLMGRVDTQVPVPEAVGPLRPVLEQLGRPDPDARPAAAEVVRALTAVAERLDEPLPLPLAGALDRHGAVGTFDAAPTLLPPGAGAGALAGTPFGDDTTVSSAATSTMAATSVTAPGPVTDTTAIVPEVVPARAPSDPPRSRLRRAGRDAGRARRRRLPTALAVALVVIALGGAVWAFMETRPPTAVIPDLASMTEEEARAALEAARTEPDEPPAWDVRFDAEHSERINEGVVIRQDPAAGTELADGEGVTVVVSLGLPFRGLPDLAGSTTDEAAELLEAAELTIGDISSAPHEEVEEGLVLDWSVGEENRPAQARKGAAVDVVVSSGPAPRQVPDLVGETRETAEAELDELGLVVEVDERFSREVEKDRVISTQPGAGANLERGGKVSIVVSRGPDLVLVPDVIEERLQDAVDVLERAGLSVGDVSGSARGQVARTRPEIGSRVERGTVVDISLG